MKSFSQEQTLLTSIFGIPVVIALRPWEEDMIRDGVRFHHFNQHILPVIYSCTNYNITTHRALPSVRYCIRRVLWSLINAPKILGKLETISLHHHKVDCNSCSVLLLIVWRKIANDPPVAKDPSICHNPLMHLYQTGKMNVIPHNMRLN